ncbi:MAG: CapA family protein [Candidatus Pacebacteria bacterium]|nr:CapA family protein [Candidatus Paceibacterota bacterium]
MRRIFFIVMICLSALAVFSGAAFFVMNGRFAGSLPGLTAQIVSPFASSDEPENASGEDSEVSIIFVGDIMLSRGVAAKMKEHDDHSYPFLKVGDYLKSADFAFGNLETSLAAGREIGPDEMLFRADPELAAVLREFNFAVVSLANNHTMNFGEGALENTLINLLKAGVEYAGAGSSALEAYNPAIIQRNGLRFAFLAFTDSDVIPSSYFASTGTAGVASMDVDKMAKAVRSARQRADFVIVSMHSGTEYKDYPNDRQTSFARSAVEAGADLVIGHHPHVVQTAEIYKGKYIFYSLGNFVFDQRWWKTKEGIALKITFDKQGIREIQPQATHIEDFSQPVLFYGEAAQNIISRLGISLDE